MDSQIGQDSRPDNSKAPDGRGRRAQRIALAACGLVAVGVLLTALGWWAGNQRTASIGEAGNVAVHAFLVKFLNHMTG